MRVMVLVKASEDSESGRMPTTSNLAAMVAFNEELVQGGVMVAGEGLHPSAKGVRVRFCGDDRTVLDGPFPRVEELVAGFWIWQVGSLQEAVEWLRQAPFEDGAVVEVRPLLEDDDFGDALTPELRQAEERMREQVAGR